MEDSRVFSVRIVSIDYYMTPPISGVDISYSTFHGGKVKEVPVIRIFGSTPAGQKTCLHIHRALPYLYIPCSDLGHVPNNEVDSCIHAISLRLEKTLKLKGNAGSKRQHVHGCSLVRARKFYGYHSTEELFVKIYFYYPQDVSRAANLLLAGAIMDKVLQPHESHIPFLLQFLIDYNLYGMDHLHVSKIKFRHPLPDVFSPRKSRRNGELNSSADDSTCMPMNSQANIGNDVCLHFPIWTSSTISDGQILQYSCHPDSSTNEDIPLYRRQSTSELEGDAIVDEIINQQFLSYEPLSQTNSEVKMVHSLIPIWEEEFERSGVPEAMPPDSGKPLPQDVLRTLSEGIDFGKFLEVTNNKESESPFTPSIKCSTDHRNSVASGLLDFEVCNNLSSKYLKASDKIGALFSLDSLSQAVNEVETSEADAIDQLQISGTMGQSTEKASDEDAFRLLKWLASSQAAEDINSDDELAHETILSPLIPAKNIDKVLEKANVDYESESQKECQDILDSIDMLNFEEFNGGVSKPIDYNHYSEALKNKIIPQVDGSSDDPQSTPCSSKSLKSDTDEADTSLEVHLLPVLDSRLIHKNQRKRPRWGSLPIFHQNVNDVSLPNAFDILSECDGEKKEGVGTTGCGNEAERFPCFVKNDERKDAIYIEQASWITECSTRELMRRKRSHRVELSKLRSPVEDWKVETCFNAEYGKGDIDLDTKLSFHIQDRDSSCLPMHKPLAADEGTKCHEKDIHSIRKICSEVSDVKPVKSCCPTLGNSTLCSSPSMGLGNMANNGNQESVQLDHGHSYCWENLNNSVNYNASLHVSSCTFEHPHSSKSDIIGENYGCRDLLQTDAGSCTVSNLAASKSISRNECQTESCSQISMQKVPENPAKGLKDMSSETTLLQFENSQSYESSPGFCMPYCSMSDYVKKEAESKKFIGMTFHNKPPMIQWTDEPENEAPVLPTYGSLNDGTTVHGRSMEGFLPFFTRNCPQEKELQAPKKYDYINHRELVMGVPVLYQNDGSFLYMLTPVISPPSRECVDRWLSFDGSHILRENMDAPSLFPRLPNGSSSVIMNSLGSQADVSYSPVLVSAPFSDANPNLDQLHQHNQESCSMEAKSLKETEKKPLAGQDFSQISGPDRKSKQTPLSQIGFQDPARVGGGQQLTLLSIEVLAESRGDLRPDPQFDPINVIVLVFQEDDESSLDVHVLLRCNDACAKKDLYAMSECQVLVFTEESQLFSHFTKLIHSIDPDVIMGWDVQSSSLGLLAERAAHLGLGLLNNISRTPSETNVVSRDSEATGKDKVNEIFSESDAAEAVHLENMVIDDEWGRTHASGVRVGGRIVLNIWRLMRNEVKLNMYTVEAVAKTVLRQTVPFIHWKVLTKWFSSGPGRARYRSIYYILERAKLNLQIINQLDVMNRTSELARVFGIDFFSVLSRGSQYRVESMFLRLAHTQNYLAISPGNHQVANQPAMECLPLVMEPESAFYSDPVIVLDFQSLYPSMVIAYNLCFCTCLGKITPPKENCLGVSSYSPDINILHNLKHELLVTPNGVVYVSPKVQKGILPRLLEEILSTRIMVKQAMKKLAPSQLILNRIFDARQLALKLIANVTYGYTAAGFSGRMPCAELADSIVQCGRKTLETAISFVNSNEKWKAKVVYGDTDSMFVLLKGRSLKEAFAIGREIASAITEMNPNPVMLKMEKVYYPCFLLTKKRYVGYSYESPDQSKPMFDAKGIETVRRDTCEAVSKSMEQSLRIYFESQNIDAVKSYMLRQWARILSGRVSIQDFVFAKEVRLGTYSARASSLPPAAIVAIKAMRADPRAEPRYAERIPYIVVHGEPGARLVDMVVDPLELLALSSPFRLNGIYYLRKQIIPTLQRVFGLVGADLNHWFLDMPRRGREGVGKCNSLVTNPLRTRIDCYYVSNHCILCGNVVQASARLCHNCLKNETTVAAALTGRSSKLEKDIQHLVAICRHCGGGDWRIESGVKCISLACPVFYERRKVQKELQSLSEVATVTGLYPKCMVEWF